MKWLLPLLLCLAEMAAGQNEPLTRLESSPVHTTVISVFIIGGIKDTAAMYLDDSLIYNRYIAFSPDTFERLDIDRFNNTAYSFRMDDGRKHRLRLHLMNIRADLNAEVRQGYRYLYIKRDSEKWVLIYSNRYGFE